jgi:hypothetical protein
VGNTYAIELALGGGALSRLLLATEACLQNPHNLPLPL